MSSPSPKRPDNLSPQHQQGEVIAQRYRIVSHLGRGGMGTVFLVEDSLRDNQRFALKALRVERLNPSVMELFKEEFRLLTQISHPNIARVYDYGFGLKSKSTPDSPQDSGVFFTSELINGVDLFKATSDRDLTKILDYCVQICRALEYMAGRGITHGDLKPGNILVQKDVVKIVDFGIAPRFFEKQIGRPCGTPKYMAPEVIRGDPVDTRADLYSLGVILYLLTTRRVPFEGKTVRQIMDQHLEDPALSPRRWRKDLPVELERIILRLLEKDPGERFFRANQIIEEINRFAQKPYAYETKEAQENYILSGKFVGRGREINRLKDLQRALFCGSTNAKQLCLITGQTGMGKTRLLREFKNYLQTSHVPVFFSEQGKGQTPFEGTPENQPFGAFSSIVQQIAAHCDPEDIEPFRPFLGPLLPGSGNEVPSSWKTDYETYQIYDQISQFLIRAAEKIGPAHQKGYALFFDNLQRFGRESTELFNVLFQNLCQRSNSIPLLIVATVTPESSREEIPDYDPSADPTPVDTDLSFRKVEGDSSNLISPQRILHHLIDRPEVLHIVLEPLQLRDIQDLIRSTTGGDFGGVNFAPQLEEASHGNPLFIQEVMKSLLEQGKISQSIETRPEFQEIDLSSLVIPRSIEEIVSNRFSRFNPGQAKILQIFSVINRPCAASEINKFCPANFLGKSLGTVERLLKVLNSLKSRDVLQMDLQMGEVVYQFTQEFFRKIAYDSITEDLRKSLHLSVAKYVEKNSHSPFANLEIIARHYIAGGEIQKAFDYSMKAAAKSQEMNAFKAATEFYHAALEIHQKHRDKDETLEMHILDELARLSRHLGDFAKAIQFLECIQDLLEQGGGSAIKKAAVLRKIGHNYHLMGNVEKAISVLQQASVLLEGTEEIGEKLRVTWLRGRILTRTGEVNQLFQESNEGLGLASGQHFPEERAELLYNRAVGHFYQNRHEQAIQDCHESQELFERLGQLGRTTYPINMMGMIRHKQGRHTDAIDFFKRAYEVAKILGDHRHLFNFAMNIGIIYHELADFTQAHEYYERARGISERFNLPSSKARILHNLGQLFLRYQHLQKSEELVNQSLVLSKRHHLQEDEIYNYLFLGEIYSEKEDGENALKYFRRALELAQQLGDQRWLGDALMGIAHAHVLSGDLAEAEKTLQKAEESSRQIGKRVLGAELNLRWAEFQMKSIRVGLDEKNSQSIRYAASAAHSHLDEAEEQAKKNLHTRLLWEIYFLRGQIHFLVDEYDQAKEFFDKSLEQAADFLQQIPEEYRHYFQKCLKYQRLRKSADELQEILRKTIPFPQKTASQGQRGVEKSGSQDEELPDDFALNLLHLVRGLSGQMDWALWIQSLLHLALNVSKGKNALLLLRSQQGLQPVHWREQQKAQATEETCPGFNRNIAELAFEMGAAVFSTSPKNENATGDKVSPMNVSQLEQSQIACLPVSHKEELFGVLYIDHCEPTHARATENSSKTARALESLCSLVGVGIALNGLPKFPSE